MIVESVTLGQGARLLMPKGLDGPKRLQNAHASAGQTEMGLHILAYNIKRAIALIGTTELIAAMQA